MTMNATIAHEISNSVLVRNQRAAEESATNYVQETIHAKIQQCAEKGLFCCTINLDAGYSNKLPADMFMLFAGKAVTILKSENFKVECDYKTGFCNIQW